MVVFICRQKKGMVIEMSNRRREKPLGAAPRGTHILLELIRAFQSARPRVDQLVDEEAKEQILDALHESREDMNDEYVVEGAIVVCTQMTEEVPIPRRTPLPSEVTSQSEMQKLDIETRKRRRRMIAAANPDSPHGGLRWSDFIGQMTMNGPRLLDHLDIEFSPLFGDDPEGDTPESEPLIPSFPSLNGGSRFRPRFPLLESQEEDNTPVYGGCGGCKEAGDCKPDIEELIWQDCERNGVSVSGGNTLMKNSAYMFCHTGQGILYISDSGQHLEGVSDELERQAAEREAAEREEEEVAPEMITREEWGPEPNTQERDGVPRNRIIIHHTTGGTINSIDHWHRWGDDDYKDPWTGGIGYHFLIRDDGVIYEGRPLEMIGAHAYPNSGSIGIAVMGNFYPHGTPSPAQLATLRWLINDLRNRFEIELLDEHHGQCPGPWFNPSDFWE